MSRNNYSLDKYYDFLKKDLYDSEEFKNELANEQIELVGWYDHIAELADVREEIDVGKNEAGNPLIQHIRHDGVIFQEGTPVNAENMAKMEWNDLINNIKLSILGDAVRALQVQVATLVGQNFNNMPYNQFVASFSADGLNILEGWYDEINQRGVLSV